MFLKPLKVLYVHHCSVPGGASTSLINLLKYLPDDKIEKYVIVPRGTVGEMFVPFCTRVFELSKNSVANFFPSAEGIDFLWPRSLLGYLRFYPTLREIRQIARSVSPDLIHLNDVPLLPSAIELKKAGYPVVMHARTAPARNRGILDKLQRRWINRWVDILVCISESVRKGYDDIQRATVVYNPAVVRQSHGPRTMLTSSDIMKCVFLSNFLAYKGIYETMEAALFLKERKDIQFYIAGSNIRSDKFYRSIPGRMLSVMNIAPDINRWILDFIREHDLHNITVLGHVSDVNALFSQMHVNLAPMRLNAPPRSVFEAAVHEVPTILALTDIVEDIVRSGVNGIIIPPRNPQAIADAILNFRSDEHLRFRLGRRAKEQLIEQHDPDIGADRILSIYSKLMAGMSITSATPKMLQP